MSATKAPSANEALRLAQLDMTRAEKNSKNPHFRSSYANLAAVQDACIPSLHEHGFVVTQPVRTDGERRYVETIFTHTATGESFNCQVDLIMDRPDMQRLGSAITYARRYGLLSLAGIAPEDDDGNAAVRRPKDEPSQQVEEIKDSTIKALLAESDKHPAFESQDVFRDWIRETCEAEIGALQEHQGQRVLQFLRGKGADMNKWGDEHLNALTKVLGKEEGK